MLGSASIDLMKQSSDSLAGRIRYLQLVPLDAGEVGSGRLDALWLRGGFPDSLMADSDAASLRWRVDFIRTYLECVPTTHICGSCTPESVVRRGVESANESAKRRAHHAHALESRLHCISRVDVVLLGE